MHRILYEKLELSRHQHQLCTHSITNVCFICSEDERSTCECVVGLMHCVTGKTLTGSTFACWVFFRHQHMPILVHCLKVTKNYHQKASTSTDLFLLIFMALLKILTLVAMGWLMVKNMIIAAEPVDFSFYIKTKKNIQFLNMFCQNMG